MLPEKRAVAEPRLQPVSSQEFVQAMGQHAASVCVITTSHEQQRYGLTATAVSSVCASPPRLLVCVNKSGVTHAKIAAVGRFCVNLIAEEQERLAKCFAGMMDKDLDRFSSGSWYDLSTGSPALLDAAAALDCILVAQIDQFSHSIFIGEVVGVSVQLGKDALLYAGRRFRSLRKTFSAETTGVDETLHF